MNKVTFAFIIMVTISACVGIKKDIQEIDGIIYSGNSETPYTGIHTIFHKNGNQKKSTTYKNGIKDGKYIIWYENGMKQAEGTYKNGKADGVYVFYINDDGKKSMEIHFKDGKQLSQSKYYTPLKVEDN